jgi:hypothetical protein
VYGVTVRGAGGGLCEEGGGREEGGGGVRCGESGEGGAGAAPDNDYNFISQWLRGEPEVVYGGACEGGGGERDSDYNIITYALTCTAQLRLGRWMGLRSSVTALSWTLSTSKFLMFMRVLCSCRTTPSTHTGAKPLVCVHCCTVM